MIVSLVTLSQTIKYSPFTETPKANLLQQDRLSHGGFVHNSPSKSYSPSSKLQRSAIPRLIRPEEAASHHRPTTANASRRALPKNLSPREKSTFSTRLLASSMLPDSGEEQSLQSQQIALVSLRTALKSDLRNSASLGSHAEQLVSAPWGLPTPPASPVFSSKTSYFTHAKDLLSNTLHSSIDGEALNVAEESIITNHIGLENADDYLMVTDDMDETWHCGNSGDLILIILAGRAQTTATSTSPAEVWYGTPSNLLETDTKNADIPEPVCIKTNRQNHSLEADSSDADDDWVGKGSGFWDTGSM